MRKCNSPLEKVLDASSFPLVPYVNRIRGGHFSFRGREIRLQPNMAGDPSPLHGQGWLNPWRVEQAGETKRSSAIATRAANGRGRTRRGRSSRSTIRGLSLNLTCRNLGREAMPCGLGQHPYFPCGARTRIDTLVTHAWTIDEHVLPVEKVPAEGRYDLRNRVVCGQDLDNGFDGWGGTARLTDPAWPYELQLSSPEAKFFQLYSPPAGRHLRRRAGDPRQCRAQRARRASGRSSECACSSLGESMSLDVRLEVIPK